MNPAKSPGVYCRQSERTLYEKPVFIMTMENYFQPGMSTGRVWIGSGKQEGCPDG